MGPFSFKGLFPAAFILSLAFTTGLASAEDQQQKVAAEEPKVLVRSSVFEGNTSVSTLTINILIQTYVGPIQDKEVQVHPNQLKKALDAITNLYRRLGHKNVIVYIPSESIATETPLVLKEDKLSIKIIEGRVESFTAPHWAQSGWGPTPAAAAPPEEAKARPEEGRFAKKIKKIWRPKKAEKALPVEVAEKPEVEKVPPPTEAVKPPVPTPEIKPAPVVETVSPEQEVLVRSFEFDGNTLVSTLTIKVLFQTYLKWPIPEGGVRVSPSRVRELLEGILSLYRKLDYRAVAVYIPEDSIGSYTPLAFKNDLLRVVIVEGRVKGVVINYRLIEKPSLVSVLKNFAAKKEGKEEGKTEDARDFHREQAWLRRWTLVQVDNFIHREELDKFVNALERHPGRSVAAVVKRAEEEEELPPEAVGRNVILEYRVVDLDPFVIYAGLNNTGSESTEELRARVGFVHNNLLGRDDILTSNFQAAADDSIGDNFGLFASYDAPLWNPQWRGRVLVAYNEFETSDILGPGTSFLGDGYVVGQEISYNIWQHNQWFLDVFQGLDFQRSTLETPFGIDSDLNLLDLSFGARIEKSKGDYRAFLEAKISPNLTGAFDLTEDQEFEKTRTGTEPGYFIFSLRGQHRKKLKEWLSIQQEFGSAYSSDRLVSAKEFFIGGLDTVRGYEEFEILGDRGFYLSTEPRVTLSSFSPKLRDLPFQTEFIPIFFDVGAVGVEDAVAGEESSTTIYSIGTGGVFYLGDVFSARMYWGYALRDGSESSTGTREGDSRFHFDLLFRF